MSVAISQKYVCLTILEPKLRDWLPYTKKTGILPCKFRLLRHPRNTWITMKTSYKRKNMKVQAFIYQNELLLMNFFPYNTFAINSAQTSNFFSWISQYYENLRFLAIIWWCNDLNHVKFSGNVQRSKILCCTKFHKNQIMLSTFFQEIFFFAVVYKIIFSPILFFVSCK